MCVTKKYSQFISARQAKRTCRICICAFFLYSGMNGLENNGRGAKAVGMANAFSAVSDNLWAINYNPAGLIQLTELQLAAFVVPGQFGMSELRTTAIAAAFPLNGFALGLEIEKFGFDLYMETEIGFACAAAIDQNISIGFNADLYRLDINRYGTHECLIMTLGILARISENVRMGFNFTNVTRACIGQKRDKLPQICSLGGCWSPFKELQISIELEKDIRFPVSAKVGIEKILFGALALRAGAANNPDKYSTGIGLKYSGFEFGYACYSHLDLGWTHQIELSICLGFKN